MNMPKEVLVIGNTTETMKVDEVLRRFKIEEHQLASCINNGSPIKTDTGDVFFDLIIER